MGEKNDLGSNNSQKSRNNDKSAFWKTKKGRWTIGILTVAVLVLGGLAFRVINDITGFGDRIYEEVQRDKKRDQDISLNNGDPISILLVGIDNGALFYEDVEEGRTDVMMVLTINPEDNSSTILSIPRDTLGPQGDTNEFDKLNHAYMNGGMEATIASLQQYLDIPIDHYVEVNMQGFIDVIDGLGGVEITPTLSFTQNGATFIEGETRVLSGEEAIHYVRMRKEDPEGDIGRQKRQQQLVEAVIDKVFTLGTITNYERILDQLEDNVKTDFKVNDMIDLQSHYLSALGDMDKYVIEDYVDLNLYYGYYLLIPEEERIRMSNHLRTQLGLESTNSAIVYPVSFGVESEYFPVEDINWNGYLEDNEMPILPGVYEQAELQGLIDEVFNSESDEASVIESSSSEALYSEAPVESATEPAPETYYQPTYEESYAPESYGGATYSSEEIYSEPSYESEPSEVYSEPVEPEAPTDPNAWSDVPAAEESEVSEPSVSTSNVLDSLYN